jgi:hypothetical protein
MASRVLVGTLEACRESRIEFAFRFEGQEEPIFLENGHHLTIYDADEKVLFVR